MLSRVRDVARVLLLTGAMLRAHPAMAQRPHVDRAVSLGISRATAIALAWQHSPRNTLRTADSLSAAALNDVARQRENPTLGASYSESTPRAHVTLDVPIDLQGARGPRIAAAAQGGESTLLRIAYDRAALELDVDTAYTRALALAARSQLSARTASDGDSLSVLARIRRDAGDASALDVELASIYAGQAHNAAAVDSISASAMRADLQALIGLPTDSVSLQLTDPLIADSVLSAAGFVNDTDTSTGVDTARLAGLAPPPVDLIARTDGHDHPLLVAASERSALAARYRLLMEQRMRIPSPSLSVGFEAIDPGGQRGLLPTIGIALPLPLFNRNEAAIRVARADLARAQATLDLVRLEQGRALAAATRDAVSARARAVRSAGLVSSANRVARLSLFAYREGASTLTAALEAQRVARDVIGQYVDDMAAVRIADSVRRLLLLASPSSIP